MCAMSMPGSVQQQAIEWTTFSMNEIDSKPSHGQSSHLSLDHLLEWQLTQSLVRLGSLPWVVRALVAIVAPAYC
jgi:hypothetical protein